MEVCQSSLSSVPETNFIDIHPGNVALPPPPHAELQRLLAKEPLEDRIRRKDGQPTSSLLPYQVIEPEDFGFGEGPCKVLDFGYAFKPMGMSYISEHFSQAMPPPPELSHGMGTTYPFKADSWNMGQLVWRLPSNTTAYANLV